MPMKYLRVPTVKHDAPVPFTEPGGPRVVREDRHQEEVLQRVQEENGRRLRNLL